ncbi:MAG: hypothetical protein KUA43_08550 [Hoeflea sp.]|uniref:hypothetical protein n=1 Tax=Hoeflea sp. TaxID=1940281 RepID=UPI001DB8E40F|nr:hypothetical protein [Hoeflea sp.]MBU4529714.1 hypothetical protein [Alphaproteobacteria bacterium]MBU4543275.1 hypothetical protein [Alphaproteobacteria bacterium]MBU4552462.1 hypothetical protein [Alphaproteobacteria bacterium]MBV1723478.1 hypothetical protein [Hoeflea sp.]MBV1762927.1 hypothetical protein [Hoeflea sp.]
MKVFLRLVLVLFASTIANVSLASDKECLSPHTKYDVCKAAREIQESMAPMLPMTMNANMTLTSVAAIGPIFAYYVRWTQTWPEIEAAMQNAGTTKAALLQMMDAQTNAIICGQETTAAFIGLGGTVQYHYITSDAVPVTTTVVSSCP